VSAIIVDAEEDEDHYAYMLYAGDALEKQKND
jgi:hypothetical protein